ncbi:WEB family protein At3g02930, chloroplastic-like isoform X1 [Primulina tabacum]|uniref:WEB family protein At3g02930, chloroplastic-like isoform X1 n=1 Tax=Primulina tabacum TaxID=48773 RepID=UPI003F5ABCBB
MSSKSKSTLSETPNSKVSLASPPISRSTSKGVAKSDADSASPLQSARLSVDRSPRSITSKPPIERRSTKLGVGVGVNPPDKKTSRLSKPSELQSELSLAQEDLKKAKETIGLLEKEKEIFLDDLKESHKLADEANEKLREAFLAQKRAEENSEIEKFRALEMEQAGIEAAQKKEDEWQEVLEAIRNRHALDVAALLFASEELHKVKKELDMAGDAKNKALARAEDATKIAEIHADKVEALSAELVHLKSLLDSKPKMEDNENDKFVTELSLEVDSLRQELKKMKIFEEKLEEREAALEHLSVDLEAAKMAESYAHNLVEELHYRVEELSAQAEQAKRLEISASESLEFVMKQLEVSNDSLQDSHTEISSLREKVGLLEFSIRRQKLDLEESERRLELVKEEASVMIKKVESIQFELESLREEKIQALSNEKLAADSVQTLLEEKHELINELENSRDEDEKTKKALESLASALHEVSAEARYAKEKLLSVEVERENYGTEIEHLKMALKATNEKCESMLNDAKQEIDILKNVIEKSKSDHKKLTAEWEQKELHLTNSVKKSVEDNSSMKGEINRLVNLVKMAEVEACAVKEEEERWKDTFKEAESEIISLKDVLGQTKDESMRLKEVLMDRENEIQNILQRNEELRNREAASVIKAEELSKLLEEALAKEKISENGELTDSEKDYDMLPKVVEFFEQNGTGNLKKPNKNSNDEASVTENLNGKHMEDDMSEEVDIKMWESCKIDEKDLSPEGETELEAFEDEPDSKADGYDKVNGLSSLSENLDNGGSSPSKQQNQKKKKPLFQKFGGLLKKRSPSSHK